MDYKKLYEEALERAREFVCKDNVEVAEYIFPKLKKSGDERIRKCICLCLEECVHNDIIRDYERDKCLAWLEKQWERKTPQWMIDFLDSYRKKIGCSLDYDEAKDVDGKILCIKKWLEKQGEQKPYGQREECSDCQFNYAGECKGSCAMKRDEQNPVDKVEPKFNIGDIIFNKKTKEQFTITGRSLALQYYHDEDHLHKVRFTEQDDWEIIKPKFHENEWITNGDYTWKIVEIKSLDYILQSQDGNIVDDTISHVDEQFHSFTIKDAKDGDVLSYRNGQWIFIYKEKIDDDSFYYHTLYSTIHQDLTINDAGFTLLGDAIIPATKEQRDLLFQKMKEDGYEWDDEKRELKKIEQSIEIPFGAKDSELQEVVYNIPKGFYAKIDGNKVIIKKGEQKPAWSEEDELQMQGIIDLLPGLTIRHNWLKSLKDRVQPKQEWSEEDEEMLVSIISDFAAAHKSSIGQDKWLKSIKERMKGE